MPKLSYTVAALAAVLLLPQAAAAKDVCKPPLLAKGMFYKSKAQARESAEYRWGLAAAQKYGAGWALVGKARGKSFSCSFGHGPKEQLFNCSLQARPCMEVSVCKGRVTARGMFYKQRPKAVESAQYRWGLKAASQHGAGFAHWGKAKARSMKCSKKDGVFNCEASAKACN